MVDRKKIIRIALAVDYRVKDARAGIGKFYEANQLTTLLKPQKVDHYVYAWQMQQEIAALKKTKASAGDDRFKTKQYGQGLRYGQYTVLAVSANKGMQAKVSEIAALTAILKMWKSFDSWVATRLTNAAYKIGNSFDYANYYKGSTVNEDVQNCAFKV